MSTTTTAESIGQPIAQILKYLREPKQEETTLDHFISQQPDDLTRAMAYVLQRGKKYYRQHMLRAIVKLFAYGTPYYRQVTWALLQKVRLSFLVELPQSIATPKQGHTQENNKRLRGALLRKLVISDQKEIFLAFFNNPEKYRFMFEYFFFPNKPDDKGQYHLNRNPKAIVHKQYLFAINLAKLGGIQKIMKHYNLAPSNLYAMYKIRIDKIINLVEDPKDAMNLAHHVTGDDFFRHARWFTSILGTQRFEVHAESKIKDIRDPLRFTQINEHLRESQTLSPRLMTMIENRSNELINELLKNYKLERVALLVDTSPSMEVATDITVKLFDALSRINENILTDLIRFHGQASVITIDQLKRQGISGSMTSIGAAVQLLYQRLIQRSLETYPQVIILISDMDENVPPFIGRIGYPRATDLLVEQGWNIPLIILHCGQRVSNFKLEYPHAIIKLDSFHDSLIMDILKDILKFSQKATDIGEQQITKVVGERKFLDEGLAEIKVPQRPEITLKKGYLEDLLTSD